MALATIISIHAPTRGATTANYGKAWRPLDFNPRTHTGCDFGLTVIPRRKFLISIHAPTRGATMNALFLLRKNDYFNPRTHTGCDNIEREVDRYGKRFQSTHPHGVRLGGDFMRIYVHKFQSTHPHGVRRILAMVQTFQTVYFNPRTHTGCDKRGC